MRDIMFVLASFFFAVQGRPVQTLVEPLAQKQRTENAPILNLLDNDQPWRQTTAIGAPNQLKALGMLLQELNPAAGFTPAALGVPLHMNRPEIASSTQPTLARTRTMSPFMQINKDAIFATDEALKESIGGPLAALRIATGLLMIHHGSEGGFWPANVGTPGFDGFVDFIVKPYFSFLPGSPVLWSAIHDYIEWIGGVFVVAGFLTRPASAVLSLTMVAAVYFHLASTGLQGFPFGHVDNYSYNFEEPALYALIFLLFTFTGAGPLSADGIIKQAISDDVE